MAKVKGPLLSMRAAGTIAKTQVFASWRGVPYVRMHVIPAYRNTEGQQLTRKPFTWLNDVYRRLAAEAVAPWLSASEGRTFTGRNLFIKQNLPVLREENDLANYIASPGAKGGPALADFAAATGADPGEVDATMTLGELPEGWTLANFYAFAIRSQDPHGILVPDLAFDSSSDPSPATITLTMGSSAVEYLVAGFASYTRPDGIIAYSVASADVVTSGS
jgi:hypothetical protein